MHPSSNLELDAETPFRALPGMDVEGRHAEGTEVTGTAQHEAWQARTLPPVERLADQNAERGELTLLGDQLASGFCAGHSLLRFEPGCDVAVFGAGPVGLGTVQG